MIVFKRKKKIVFTRLNSFELYLLRELLPFFPSYEKINISFCIEKLFETLSYSDQNTFQGSFNGIASDNVLCFLIEEGYVSINRKFREVILKEKDEVYGLNQVKFTDTYFLTDKGRSLKNATIYKNKHRSKMLSISIVFRHKEFYKKYIKPTYQKIASKIKKFKKR